MGQAAESEFELEPLHATSGNRSGGFSGMRLKALTAKSAAKLLRWPPLPSCTAWRVAARETAPTMEQTASPVSRCNIDKQSVPLSFRGYSAGRSTVIA